MGHCILHVQIPEELDQKLADMVAGLALVTGKRATKKGVVIKALERSFEIYEEEYAKKVEEARRHQHVDAQEMF